MADSGFPSFEIIGEETDLHVQGYFVYDSKKSGATTVSHLRTSPRRVRSAYLISKARYMNLTRAPDPDAYERANYMLMLQGWRG